MSEYRLTDKQIDDLARPLVSIIQEYYKDPENVKRFEEWLKERNRKVNAGSQHREEN